MICKVIPTVALGYTAKVAKQCLLSSREHHAQTITRYLWEIMNNPRTLCGMCSNCLKCLYMLRIGRADLFWSANALARSGTNLNKPCDRKYKQLCHVGNGVGESKLGGFQDMLHSQVTCGIQNQRQEVCCAYLDHTRLFPSRGCARSKPQFLTAVESLKLFRLTQVHVWMVYQLYNFGSAYWKDYPVDQPRETLSVTDAKESSRLIHMLTLVYLSPLTTFLATFPTAPTQPNSTSSKTLRQWSKRSAKDEAQNLWHVTRTHRVDLDWLFERANLDSFLIW